MLAYILCCVLQLVATNADLSLSFGRIKLNCYTNNNIMADQNFAYYVERCRALKQSLECIQDEVEFYKTTLVYLYMKPELEKLRRSIESCCVAAKNSLCSSGALSQNMKRCYDKYGVNHPPQNMTHDYIKHHCSMLEDILTCMVSAVHVCPDDEQLAVQIEAISNWKEDLRDMCGYNDTKRCSSDAISEKMNTCFMANGIGDPPTNMSESYIENHCSQLEGTLTCLAVTVLSCPDHEHTFNMTLFILNWRRHVERLCSGRTSTPQSTNAVTRVNPSVLCGLFVFLSTLFWHIRGFILKSPDQRGTDLSTPFII